MNKRFLLIPLFAAACSLVQAAAVYKVKLMDPVIADGKELKAGEYKVEVNGSTATFRNGKDATEVSVKSETADTKYDSTTVRYSRDGSKNNLQEIHVGGTKMKLIVDSAKSANGGI